MDNEFEQEVFIETEQFMEDFAREEGIGIGINRLAYFAFNYPLNWVEDCFEPYGETMVKHFRSEFNNLCDNNSSSDAVLLLYLSLTDEKQRLMEEYIINNYKNRR